TSTRSLAKNPPSPPERTFSAPTILASGPRAARTLARASSIVAPSNRRVGKVHHSHGLEVQLRPELGVRQHRQARGHRLGETPEGGPDLGRADQHRRLAPLL